MGATREQEASGWKPDRTEYPVHKVTLNTFYIGETEVTKELWSAVMETECDYSDLNTISLKAWSGTTFNLLSNVSTKQRD